jgi:PST family polysaccharide transporter
VLEWPLSLWWLSRTTVIPVRALLGGALGIAGCAVTAGAVCALAVQLASGWSAVGRLAAGLAAGLAVYGLAALVPPIRRDLAGVAAWGRQMLARRG